MAEGRAVLSLMRFGRFPDDYGVTLRPDYHLSPERKLFWFLKKKYKMQKFLGWMFFATKADDQIQQIKINDLSARVCKYLQGVFPL